LAEGLLNALKYGVIETLDLLRRWLAAEEAGNLRAVVPGLGVTCSDWVLQGVWTAAEVDKRIDGTGSQIR
jgi:hypothetical protein